VSDEQPFATWPPSRRWVMTTGTLVVVAACAGIILGLVTSDDKKPRTTTATTAAGTAPVYTDSASAVPGPKLTTPSFTASSVGVGCQVAGKKLVCSRAGAGRATLTTSGRLKLEPTAGSIQGGPALAPGQLWASIGISCAEKRRGDRGPGDPGLYCVLKESESEHGFFADASGFVTYPR
jgi:hypothetical protein